MMELRCPECASPEVEHDPEGGEEARWCANCGARFPRDSAFVTVFDAEAHRGVTPQPLFALDRERAGSELRSPDGAIWPISPHSDADELNVLIDGAQAAKAIEGKRPAPASTSTRSRSVNPVRCSPSTPASARPCSAQS